jgi:hypothetical protein
LGQHQGSTGIGFKAVAMVTFLQPVDLSERCFLHEVLLWIAFRRLPVAEYTTDGVDIRNTPDILDLGGYSVAWAGAHFLWEDEAKFAGIPDDPSRIVHLEDLPDQPAEHYDSLISLAHLNEVDRARFRAEREKAKEFHEAYARWKPHYDAALEYPASKLFVALRDGSLMTKGRRIEGPNIQTAFDAVDESGINILEIEPIDVPRDFWTLKGIDFEASAASNSPVHFVQIHCDTNEMLAAFPCEEEGEEVHGIVRIGGNFVLNENKKSFIPKIRGRPAYPWERFHVELASLVQRNELPQKKEAAIAHFQSWFQSKLGIRPSRAAIGDKLKPYYDRLMVGQKISR